MLGWSNCLVDVEDLDVTDPVAAAQVIGSYRPDVICHLAGCTGAEASLANPGRFFDVNAGGTLHVLEAARRCSVRSFVLVSSITVHGFSQGQPVTEDTEFRPQHPYAASKAAAEMLAKTYAAAFGLRVVVARPTILVGSGQAEPNAVSEFVGTAAAGRRIVLFGDGSHRREWLHVDDAARGVRLAVEHAEHLDPGSFEPFILSSAAPISMRELAELVVLEVGSGEVEFAPANRRAFSLTAEIDKARRELGWAPQHDVRSMIRDVMRPSTALLR